MTRATSFVLAALLVASALPLARCWGPLGHNMTALFAQMLINRHSFAALQAIIPDGDLAAVVNWPDQIREQKPPLFPWSFPLHYIDVKDQPPVWCNVSMERDCPTDMCVVGAIYNFSIQALKGVFEPEALKFLIHFIGDIHQPLHVVNRLEGGNLFNVTFFGRPSELHYVWDSAMINHRISFDGNDTTEWTMQLLHKLVVGEWSHEVGSWIHCNDPTPPDSPICPLEWAAESGAYNCISVWPENVHDPALGQRYYNKNLPVVELQLAKAGVRMAAVLDWVFANAKQ